MLSIVRKSNIFRVMANQGLSGAALADVSGVSQPCIVQMLQGKSVRALTARKVADALDCAVDMIFNIESPSVNEYETGENLNSKFLLTSYIQNGDQAE